ncbi:MAG: hypothetical protein ACYSWP_13405, partial [Planctomycetota bacterium]
MNLLTIAGLSIGTSCFLLAAITLIFGKTKLHRLLMFFNLTVAGWGIGLFVIGISRSEEEARLAWIFAQCFGIFIAPVFFHLTCSLCEVKHKKLLLLAYGQALLFSALCIFTDIVIDDLRYAFGIYFIDPNIIYTSALLLYIFFVALSYFELVKFLKHAKGQKRIQTLYNIFGFMLGFLGGSSIFLPMYNLDKFIPNLDKIIPIGNFGITIYVFILTYAIFRHQLMDITVIIKKTFSYSVILLLLIVPCFIVLVLSEKYLPRNMHYPILAGLFVLVGLVYPRIKVQAERNLETILFRGVFDYKKTLDNLSKKIATLHNL